MALNGRVLLLNQTYEPLGTVSVARAVVMTFKDKVTVEQIDGDRVLRSARAEVRVPSVIRRRTYINVRRRREASEPGFPPGGPSDPVREERLHAGPARQDLGRPNAAGGGVGFEVDGHRVLRTIVASGSTMDATRSAVS